jgi:hypothetical protein
MSSPAGSNFATCLNSTRQRLLPGLLPPAGFHHPTTSDSPLPDPDCPSAPMRMLPACHLLQDRRRSGRPRDRHRIGILGGRRLRSDPANVRYAEGAGHSRKRVIAARQIAELRSARCFAVRRIRKASQPAMRGKRWAKTARYGLAARV